MQVSVITINYNSSAHTLQMVNSLINATKDTVEYEIIIVDNASEEEDFVHLKPLAEDPRIRIIRSRINGGFASGNMLGVQYATGEYYLFLNNDTLVKDNILALFCSYADEHREAGLLSGQLYDETGKRSTSFKKFPSLLRQALGSSFAKYITNDPFPGNKTILTAPTEVGVVSGSCMFFRRDVFDQIGGFDTVFFLYCEEEDISQRVWNQGFKVISLPQVTITHFAGGSTKRNLAIEKEFYISYMHLLKKHFPIWQQCLLQFLQLLKLLRRSLRSLHYFHLFVFLLKGAPLCKSLRYHQQLKD